MFITWTIIQFCHREVFCDLRSLVVRVMLVLALIRVHLRPRHKCLLFGGSVIIGDNGRCIIAMNPGLKCVNSLRDYFFTSPARSARPRAA